jgi:hypothetical protein
MILYLFSTLKISANYRDETNQMDCVINNKSSQFVLRTQNDSDKAIAESLDNIENKISYNAIEYKVKIITSPNNYFKYNSKNENQSLNNFTSEEKNRENSLTSTFISQEKLEKVNYRSVKSSELNNIPIHLLMLQESIKNTDDLNNLFENSRHNINLIQNLKTPIKNNKPFLSLQFFSSIGIGARQDNYDENIEWQKLKHNNETYLFNISHSLKISKVLHSNWKLNIGFEYISHISMLKGVNIQMQQTLVPSDSARYQNINGTNYYHNGYLVKTSTIRQDYDVMNTYSSYLIPLSITYTKQIKNNNFIFGIGSQFNILNEFEGYTYNEASKIEKIDLIAKKNIQGSFGLNSIFTTLTYSKNINSKLGVLMEIEYCFPLLPAYIQNNPSDQIYKSNYSFGQFKLGVQYRLK